MKLTKFEKSLQRQHDDIVKEANIRKYTNDVANGQEITYDLYINELQLYRNQCAFILALLSTGFIDDDFYQVGISY